MGNTWYDHKDNNKDKFKVLTDAQNLVKYTLKITSNKKVFTEDYQHSLTDDIVSKTKDIFMHAWRANDIKVLTYDDYQRRLKYQNYAIESCTDVLALIEIAFPVFHLKGKKVKYWGKLVMDERRILRSWKHSDNERFEHLKNEKS